MPGQLFVISGPSGAGKSTIVRALRERLDSVGYSISHTSRKPRKTERDGIDYHFVDRKTFERMIEAGEFAEWASVYTDYYGTSLSGLRQQTSLGLDVLLDLDSQGAQNLKNHFKETVLIYLLPPSIQALERRLKVRGTDSEVVIKTRTKKALQEIRKCTSYDYIIVNDDLEKATEEAKSIVISERCRTARRATQVKSLFDMTAPPHR